MNTTKKTTLQSIITVVIVVVIGLLPKFILAQEEFSSCGTVFEGEPVIFAQNKLTQARTMMNNDDPFVFKVRVNFIDGVANENEKETNALDIVGVLNLYFNQHNFFFKYAGYVTREGLSTTYNSTMTNTYNGLCDNEFIEIFVVNTIPGSPTGTTSISFFSGGNGYGKYIVIEKNEIPIFNSISPTKGKVLTHEMGHYFGLLHPWQRWYMFDNVNLTYVADDECSTTIGSVTHYPVEENLDGSEWNTRGDFVQDTNPDRFLPRYKKQGSNLNLGYSVINCELTENSGLAVGSGSCPAQPFDLSTFEPNISNIMALYPYFYNSQNCSYEFTEGQVERMIAMINFVPFLYNKLIDIEELYEPYFVENIPTQSVVSTEDFGSYALVCYSIMARRYKFQKGFNYQFVTGYDSSPTLTLFNKFEAPVIELFSTASTDYTIQQIDENDSKYMFFICTRGMKVCFEQYYRKGLIGSTEMIGSSQLTITQLNQQEVTNPDLIENLESNKYHIIEKETESGAKTTQTIYKTN